MLVTLKDFTPPERFDGIPFTLARIEESTLAAGPWATVEVQTLSPVDSDPKHPLTRDFTTELATVLNGWYRITFIDGTGDESLPSSPIQYVVSVALEVRPTVRQLSALMRARTRGEFSNQGVFNDQTSPTADEADDILDDALDMVLAKLGTDIPTSLYRMVTKAVLFKSATLVELTYYPEQANADNSAYSLYNNQYMELMGGPQTTGTIVDALQGDTPTGSGQYLISVPLVGSTGFIPLSTNINIDDLLA